MKNFRRVSGLFVVVVFWGFIAVSFFMNYMQIQTVQANDLETMGKTQFAWVTGALTPTAYLPIVVVPEPLLYVFDDFSDPGSGWDIYDGWLAATEYKDGEYRIVSAQGAVYKGSANHEVENFEVSVDCRLEDEDIYFNGTGYCAITFGNSATGVHEFAIDSSKNWYLYHIDNLPYLAPYDNLNYTLLVSGSSSDINSALLGNRLKVNRQDGQVTLSINGVTVYQNAIVYSGKAYISLKSVSIRQNSYGYDARFDNYELIEK
ncbi:MAG: hypothetical protein R6X34_25445 [Chloroflexota bacterium]